MKIKIAINTVLGYSETTLPIITKSLIDSGIDKQDIFIFEGGHENKTLDFYNEMVYYKTNHNSLESTALIEIVENEIESDYWFYIHDTFVVGNRFKLLLNNIPESKPDVVALRRRPSMNIGSYKYSYLLLNKEKILSNKNYKYDLETLQQIRNFAVSNEDYLIWENPNAKIELYNDFMNNNEDCNTSCYLNNRCPHFIVENYENIYGSSIVRRVEYFPQLDLKKYKSNWGESSNLNIGL